MIPIRLYILFLFLVPCEIFSFVIQLQRSATSFHNENWNQCSTATALYSDRKPQDTQSVYLDTTLTDDRVRNLFAWISRAFSGDEQYNNLMIAMAAVFGTNLPPDSVPLQMMKTANITLPEDEEALTGEPIPMSSREQSSLGAMGAGQWTGQYKTRPHSLLDVSKVTSNLTSVQDWVRTLPRGCRRTLKRANDQNFTVITRPIRDRMPAPHSSLAHFRCVVEHEVRLYTHDEYDTEGFLQALSASVGRYIETTRMVGEIQEYRNSDGRVIAFAHEVRKGRAIRGQWFYGGDEASKSYVWFHSVQELVRRAIDDESVDTADLGPSGSDAFSELKAKYGFVNVDDWPAVADYTGSFRYTDEPARTEDNEQRMMNLWNLFG